MISLVRLMLLNLHPLVEDCSIRVVFLFSVFVLFGVPGFCRDYLTLCTQNSLQLLCSETCRSACNDLRYSDGNQNYCSTELKGRDDASCSAIFAAVEVPESLLAPAVVEEPSPADECNKLERIRDQILCRQQSQTSENPRPNCSDTPQALEQEAALLSTMVEQELSQYGELLTRDYSDVSNRDLLCEFSMPELEENYVLATDDPESLRVTQENTRELQECRKEWEAYYRNRSQRGDTSDSLTDNLVRDSQETMRPLTERMQELSRSISNLERAGATIENLILLHYDWCPSAGVPTNP